MHWARLVKRLHYLCDTLNIISEYDDTGSPYISCSFDSGSSQYQQKENGYQFTPTKGFQLIFDSIRRLQFEANSDTIAHSLSSSNLLFKREEKNTLIQNETLLIEDCLSEAFIESTNNNKDAQHFDDCLPNPKKMKHCNKAEQQNCFKNCSKSRTEKNV